MKQPEQSYTAIETAHGFVFFTDTTEGQKNRQDFLQFMADHYFDPHFNLGPVNVYRAEGVLKDGSYVNPGEGLYPEYAYLQMDKTPEMELVYRNEMKPTWEDFGSFCHNMHCTSSHRNRNIADILEEIETESFLPPKYLLLMEIVRFTRFPRVFARSEFTRSTISSQEMPCWTNSSSSITMCVDTGLLGTSSATRWNVSP